MSDTLHPSHKTRISLDASSFDEICTLCGATDRVGGGWGALARQCPEASSGEPTAPGPLPIAFERAYAENEGEPVAWRSRRRGSDDGWDLFFTKPAPRSDYEDQPLYAHPDPAVERLQRELEETEQLRHEENRTAVEQLKLRLAAAPLPPPTEKNNG